MWAAARGGARVFTDQDLENLRIISCLKASGMPIKDIREFLHWCALGDESLSQRYQMFLERKAAVEAQMEQLRRTMEVIEYKCWYYKDRPGGGDRGCSQERECPGGLCVTEENAPTGAPFQKYPSRPL